MMHECIMAKIGGSKKCKLSKKRKFSEKGETFIFFRNRREYATYNIGVDSPAYCDELYFCHETM